MASLTVLAVGTVPAGAGGVAASGLPAQAATPAPSPTASATPTSTAASGAGVLVAGTITNGTAGGSVPAGLSVTATEIDTQANTLVAQVKAPVGAGNAFQATLPGDPGDEFAVQTDYKGVTYVAQAHPPTATALPIYETSTDNASITVPSETLTILKGKAANTFNVIQLMRFANSSDRTYVGTPDSSNPSLDQTVELPIPGGASSFIAGPGLQGSVSIGADGQPAASDPIVPGATDISYLYTVTVANSGWPLSRAVIYPTSRAEILLEPGLTLTGPGLKLSGHPVLQNQHYSQYIEGALSPGTTLNADVTLTSSSSSTLWIGLVALLVLVVIAALVVPRLVRGIRAQNAARAPTPAAAANEREKLIEQVAILDEAHQASRISDDDYETRRAELKSKLLALEGAEAPGAEIDTSEAEGEAEPEPEGEAEPDPEASVDDETEPDEALDAAAEAEVDADDEAEVQDSTDAGEEAEAGKESPPEPGSP